jgi:hypothetical protein
MTLLAAMTASLNLLLRAGDSRNVLMRKLLIRKCAHDKMRLPEKVITERSLVASPTGASWYGLDPTAYSWEACGESLVRGIGRCRDNARHRG